MKRQMESLDEPQPNQKRQAIEHGRGPRLPSGWLACPNMGKPIKLGVGQHRPCFIPIKVPLNHAYNSVVPPESRFTPQRAVELAREQGLQVGTVIDLTNTSRYYDPAEWEALGVEYYKVECRGRGEAPQPEAVSLFHYCALVHAQTKANHILIHCTHGFNRTGFMIASWLVRNWFTPTVAEAVKIFATHRPPGIYKRHYVEELFTYYHEKSPPALVVPPVPEWKPAEEEDSPSRNADAAGSGGATGEPQASNATLKHDDPIGEEVPYEVADEVQRVVLGGLVPDSSSNRFPGSQPVSLARSNLHLLEQRRYWVTWKADGTRYMLLLCKWGAYLIDRSFNVRRVQMRFPTRGSVSQGRLVGGPHHNTLLDGEMVVDEEFVSGKKRLRFLVYDLMIMNGTSVIRRPFKERYLMIQEEVMKPRLAEAQAIQAGKHKMPYIYSEELFSIRRKEFYPLLHAKSLIFKFIPSLSHEADGLIFQGYEDHYVPTTCNELLKWKFAHLNSVDFLLDMKSVAQAEYNGAIVAVATELCLLETRSGRQKGGKPLMLNQGNPIYLVPLPGARVLFSGGENPKDFHGKVIECTKSLSGEQDWVFLRERTDKNTPNAYHVYEKVMQSITDNITEDELLAYVDQAVKQRCYEKDRPKDPVLSQ